MKSNNYFVYTCICIMFVRTSVGHVSALGVERSDAFLESQKTLVDLRSFHATLRKGGRWEGERREEVCVRECV